jgi:hypothetical protein
MPGPSHSSDGARERYERVGAVSAKLLALLVGGPPDTPLDLVVEMLDALIQDAQELEVSAADVSGDIRHRLFSLQIDQASAEPTRRARIASSVARLEAIGGQVATQRHVLEQAIGSAHQAFKELAAAGGPPSRALLDRLNQALSDIQSSAARLDRLGFERSDAVSLATLDPREDAAAPPSITPAPGVREAADPGGIVRAPRFAEEPAPPGTTIQPPYGDDQLRGPISPPF